MSKFKSEHWPPRPEFTVKFVYRLIPDKVSCDCCHELYSAAIRVIYTPMDWWDICWECAHTDQRIAWFLLAHGMDKHTARS